MQSKKKKRDVCPGSVSCECCARHGGHRGRRQSPAPSCAQSGAEAGPQAMHCLPVNL